MCTKNHQSVLSSDKLSLKCYKVMASDITSDITSDDEDGIMARVGLYGKLGELNLDSEKISTYLKRMKLYREANEVGDDKNIAVLPAVIGPKT